uniref:Uncharacterized protein n=1 Tax=Rhizophora mucronata TaxID=61149 RepID=A0A2P2KDY7_RHIMU
MYTSGGLWVFLLPVIWKTLL